MLRRDLDDVDLAVRRQRVVQLLVMQGLMALALLVFAFVSRGSRRSLSMSLWTLIVPLGFGGTYWTALRRYEAKRAAGAWSMDIARAEDRRGMSMLGAVFVAWILGMFAIFVLT